MRAISELVPTLSNLTQRRKLQWEGAGAAYATKINQYTIEIWKWDDEDDGTNGYSIGLKNQNMDIIDTYIADSLSLDFETLQNLFQMARRIALNVDKALDEIEFALKKIE